MRREQRHHLKENPLAVLLTEAQRLFTERGRAIFLTAGILCLAIAIAGAYFAWTKVKTQQAGELLVKAMSVLEAEIVAPNEPSEPATTVLQQDSDATGEHVDIPAGSYVTLEAKLEDALPMFIAVADKYPGTQQGVIARYQAASLLARLDRAEESTTHYRQVVEIAGEGLYGQMGLMGLSEAYLLMGQTSEAIAVLETQIGMLNSIVPLDAVLMRLGWAYRLAGQPADALVTLTRVVEEFPVSVYYSDAQTLLEILKFGINETALTNNG